MQTIEAFDREFPTDDACKRFLVEMRWPEGVTCPRCGESERIYALKTRAYHWICKSGAETLDKQTGEVVICHRRNGYRFSVITRTIFENTKIPLKHWFKVAYLVLTSKKGMSALQIHRIMFGENSGSAYHTSWYMVMRWRAAMSGDIAALSGIVEVDETFIGGKQENRHAHVRAKYSGRGAANTGKVAVIGAISRKGNVVAKVIENTTAETLSLFVEQTVADKVSLIATDEYAGYTDLKHFYPHQTVNHKAREYVRGEVHTNNIENFWSLLKRGVIGTYHHVSKDYLPMYVNEFSFRFNNRKNGNMFADLIQGVGR
jgi:transposase-like protein